jgi:hypothetical protein
MIATTGGRAASAAAHRRQRLALRLVEQEVVDVVGVAARLRQLRIERQLAARRGHRARGHLQAADGGGGPTPAEQPPREQRVGAGQHRGGELAQRLGRLPADAREADQRGATLRLRRQRRREGGEQRVARPRQRVPEEVDRELVEPHAGGQRGHGAGAGVGRARLAGPGRLHR